jgi:hypothetical protein
VGEMSFAADHQNVKRTSEARISATLDLHRFPLNPRMDYDIAGPSSEGEGL